MRTGILALALLLTACGGSRAPTASDPYLGVPSVYDLVNDGAPLPPQRLAAIAEYLRRLERDRMGVSAHDVHVAPPDAMTPFGLLLAWIMATPDVTIVVNPYLSMYSDGHGADIGPILTMGATFGMTAYALEHPGADPRGTPMHVSGIEFALHWYEQSLAAGEAHNTFADDLLARRDRGELGAWFESTVRFAP